MTDNHDALARYLDDLANGEVPINSQLDPELVATVRRLGEIGQLLHQVRPVVAHGVLRVVPEFLDGVDVEAAVAQTVEHHPVGAGGKAVAVRKNDRRH